MNLNNIYFNNTNILEEENFIKYFNIYTKNLIKEMKDNKGKEIFTKEADELLRTIDRSLDISIKMNKRKE